MCELLGMNANVPTDIRFSFSGLCRRGGDSGPHSDGWGIAFHTGRGVKSFHDSSPSAFSPLAKFVLGRSIKSRNVVAHVRKANRGAVNHENTHPFTRELWGRKWSFAHNGQLKGVKKKLLGGFRPVGTTDSEHAFCLILEGLRSRFPDLPSSSKLDAAVAELCREMSVLGVFNALMSDGRTLYAFCGKRLSLVSRQAPFGKATLDDETTTFDFSGVAGDGDRIVVAATRPLTIDENWKDVPIGTLVAMRGGRVAATIP